MSFYPTTTRGHCTHYTNDIVRFMKQNIQEPEAQPYKSRKVWVRNDKHRVEERSDHLWKKHFHRRQDNFIKGFYSVPWKSFIPMGGDVVLDSGELVTQTLAKFLKSRDLMRHSMQLNERVEALPPVEDPAVNQISSTESIEAKNFSRAGFQDIMDTIKVTRERISFVRAGMPYEEHVRLMERLSKNNVAPQETGMQVMSLTNLYFMVMSSKMKNYRDTDRDTNRSDGKSISPRPLATSSPVEKPMPETSGELLSVGWEDQMLSSASEYLTCSEDSENLVLRVNSEVTERKERIRRNHLEYLRSIHDVILYIRRMQTRDLRSKTPLSRENLRDLLKLPTGTDKDSRQTQKRFSRNNRRMSMDTSLSGDTSSISQDGGRLSVFGTGTTRRRSRGTSVFGNNAGMSGRKKSRMWDRDYLKVETWEDLLALDDKLPSDGSPAAMTQNIISKTLKWSRRMSCVPGEAEERENRKAPVWQQVAMEKNTSMFTEPKKQNKQEDSKMIVERVRHNMAKLKHNLQQQTESELQGLERVKMLSFKFKLHCFDNMQPSTLLQTHCEQMQESTNLIQMDPDVEVQPSKWYEALQERTYTKIAANDYEINEILYKIGRFAQMGPKTLIYPKAKICLLVMSLPAYEICRIPMQAALRFVMNKILFIQGEHVHHWLALRKMPNVLIR